jgi:hypothetical protein
MSDVLDMRWSRRDAILEPGTRVIINRLVFKRLPNGTRGLLSPQYACPDPKAVVALPM